MIYVLYVTCVVPRNSIFYLNGTWQHLTSVTNLFQLVGTSRSSSLNSIAFLRTNRRPYLRYPPSLHTLKMTFSIKSNVTFFPRGKTKSRQSLFILHDKKTENFLSWKVQSPVLKCHANFVFDFSFLDFFLELFSWIFSSDCFPDFSPDFFLDFFPYLFPDLFSSRLLSPLFSPPFSRLFP